MSLCFLVRLFVRLSVCLSVHAQGNSNSIRWIAMKDGTLKDVAYHQKSPLQEILRKIGLKIYSTATKFSTITRQGQGRYLPG